MRLFGLFCCLLPAVWSAAADGGDYSFDLNWQENAGSYVKTVRLDRQEPFGKEPDVGPNTVLRGVLDLGYAEFTKNAGFLWDKTNQKLYVDLNADGDLTNDANSVLTSAMAGEYQMFPAFLISFESDEGIRQFRMEARLRDASWGKQAEFPVVSGYAGTVELYGRKWDFRIWDYPNSKISEFEYFSAQPAPKENESVEDRRYKLIPENLFLDGRCYAMSRQFQQKENKTPTVKCVLNEKRVSVAELKIEGQYLKSLAFFNEHQLILPELTGQPLQVPVGEYKCHHCILEKDGITIWGDVGGIKVSIEEGCQNSLKIGGPLKQSVIVNRSGKSLDFTYQLTGAGGERYDIRSLQNYDYSKTPSVAVYKGTTQLASGSFAYG